MARKIKQGFGEAFAYLRKSLFFIYFATILFVGSVLVAFLYPAPFSFFDDWLREIVNKIIGLSPIELILFIFQNNALSSIFMLMLGAVAGIVPVVNVLVNGALLGYVFSRAIDVGGLVIMWRILPHGIFELPAIMISAGLGIKFGMFVFSKNRKQVFVERLISSLNVFLYIILPLLIVAAIIEGLLITLFG